ncbi:MAG: hypothetical protein OXC82_04705, partial [Rhodobacteraceae bacterium]|nr:hypothetical protein [Paracoccaceae bacterium]
MFYSPIAEQGYSETDKRENLIQILCQGGFKSNESGLTRSSLGYISRILQDSTLIPIYPINPNRLEKR